MRRRDLLKAGFAGAAVGPWFLRRAGAAPWGILQGNPWGGPSPIKRVFEIFLYGGLSPWETFYLNPKTGVGLGTKTCPVVGECIEPAENKDGDKQWGLFQCEFESIAKKTAPGQPITMPFANGIHLGPATRPLWRQDLLNRMRVLVSTHDLLPHEAAIPFCLTGTRLGRSTMSGTGAAVERKFGGNGTPAAFIIKPAGDRPADNIKSILSVGEHPASNRPLMLETQCGGPDISLLNRTRDLGQEQLLKFYRDQYRSRLTREGLSTPVRNRAFDEYSAMVDSFLNTQNIKTELDGYNANDPILGGSDIGCVTDSNIRCVGEPIEKDRVRQAMNFGAYLLRPDPSQPNRGAKYVCVVDVGREDASEAGYDTHGSFHSRVLYRNLNSTLSMLAKLTDPGTMNNPAIPADTLIVLTTEFGRSPGHDPAKGRKHWPHSYVQVILPPADARLSGKTILGNINEDSRIDAAPGQLPAITATDLRAAMLTALEIEPFAPGNFGSGGLSEGIQKGDEQKARENLVKEVLGYAIS